MSRLPMYSQSADGVCFTLPIDPKRRSELPNGLRSVKSLNLIVPLLYPLQDLRVQFNEVEAQEMLRNQRPERIKKGSQEVTRKQRKKEQKRRSKGCQR